MLEDFSKAAAAATVTLQAAIEVGDATVLGVESELSRLLINLLSNALQHSPPDGTGLGLAIAQVIARRHGGLIRVESALGEGATFSLRVPAVRRLP